MKLITVVIPVVRPEKAKRCINALKQNAGIPEKDYEIVTEEDKERIGCPLMVKKLVDRTVSQKIVFLGDDTIPQKNILKNALEKEKELTDGWGMVGFNDGTNRVLLATHFMVDRRLLPALGGEVFHTGYKHCYCDQELTHRCIEMGKYIYARNASLLHVHPVLMKDEELNRDKDYKRVYSKEYTGHDLLLFLSRIQNRWA